jgi:hypothetical protein
MAPPAGNSRTTIADAGWNCVSNGFEDRIPDAERNRPFSWLNPVPLWQSRNDRVARRFGDPTNDERRKWMALVRATHGTDLTIDHGDLAEPSFIVAGDTGEGDASQWAVVPRIEQIAAQTHFMVIASDVIYPAGGVDDYENKFFRPYERYPRPIYAVPGNHDWYDGLTGFMFHLCGQRTPPPKADAGPRSALGRLLWRKAKRPDPAKVADMLRFRAAPEQRSAQASPYWVIDTGPLQLVGIDTGITNVVDRDQGDWLRAVSVASRKPKILITGKPIYVDGRYQPGEIEGGGTVDDVVRDPAANYVAAIGGDIHNYQRYPVRLPGGRVIMYLVSGGGGAFMHATHSIPRVSMPVVEESDFRCYPLRGDSLSFYSRAYANKVRWNPLRRLTPIGAKQAASYMSERLGIAPAKGPSVLEPVTLATRRAAERIFPKAGPNARGLLQPIFSEYLDWNAPPLFKHVLWIEASEARIRIRCMAATGCVGDDRRDPEDDLLAQPGDDGRLSWTWPTR